MQDFRLAFARAKDYTPGMEWNDRFMAIFTEMVARFHTQEQVNDGQFVLPHEQEVLASIGYTPQEMYGYVEDYAQLGDPSPGTVLLIAAARRSFFLTVQRGIVGSAQLRETDLPTPEEALQDISYLPRIIRKAEAKLYGTLPIGTMFYCAKDREFLRTHGGIHPADFLYVVWGAHGDRQKIVSYVLRMMSAQKESCNVNSEK